MSTFAIPNEREHSSAGLEHLPYKQGVTGSNPVAPTKTKFFHTLIREHSSAGLEHLPYKQGVTGSNPVAPTTKSQIIVFHSVF